MDSPPRTQAGSLTHQMHQADAMAGSHRKSTAASSSVLLPVELIVEIVRYLSTSDAARSARISSTWQAASKDVRIWRHLSFTRFNVVESSTEDVQARLKALVKSFSAKSGNTVESVDFGHLESTAVESLAKGLLNSARSLKHIYWKSSPVEASEPIKWSKNDADEAATLAVIHLAKMSPRLETLELFVAQLYSYLSHQLSDESNDRLQSLARPRYFRLSVGDPYGIFKLPEGPAALIKHATEVELAYANGTPRKRQVPLMDLVDFRRLIEENPAIERLKVHGLRCKAAQTSFSVSSPSLKQLDLRFATSSSDAMMLDAPELHELDIGGRILRNLTPRSTSALSTLTLHLENLHVTELRAIVARVESHRGSLKLEIGYVCAREMLQLLSKRFLWPGLEEVSIKITDFAISDLIGVVAARQVGVAGGASSEQYFGAIHKAKKKLTDLRTCQVAQYLVEAEEVLAAADAIQHNASFPPLCSQVKWTLIDTCSLDSSNQVLDWLCNQPNVRVQRAQDLQSHAVLLRHG